MIGWRQKLKLKEIPRASNKTPKNPWTQNLTSPRTKNIFCFSSDILYRKTTFEYPLKSILKSSHPKKLLANFKSPCQIVFLKKSQNQKSQPPKNSFDHPRHLKSGVPSSPPPPERSTRSFFDVSAFVEKERVTKPYKFGTVREAHARSSVERERNKQGSVKCVVILALRSTEEENLMRLSFFFFFLIAVYLQNTCYSCKC